jgi:hypothetical protein
MKFKISTPDKKSVYNVTLGHVRIFVCSFIYADFVCIKIIGLYFKVSPRGHILYEMLTYSQHFVQNLWVYL